MATLTNMPLSRAFLIDAVSFGLDSTSILRRVQISRLRSRASFVREKGNGDGDGEQQEEKEEGEGDGQAQLVLRIFPAL